MEQSISAERGGFFRDILRGAAIGLAFIVPGFSGGTVAALLGVYEKIIGALTDLRHFKRSFFTLLPFAIGMAVGIAALIFPIRWALQVYPVPTVTLFIGLSLGGLPALRERAGKFRAVHLLSFLVPLVAAAGLAFLPHAERAEGFLYDLDILQYLTLFFAFALAACALVVPGISGSMILLIFGYYAPIIDLASNLLFHGTQPLVSIFVLLIAGMGMAFGFIGISYLMKFFLKKFPHGTYFAILGFILGSVAAVYASVPASLATPWEWVVSLLLLLVGAASSLILCRLAKKK